MNRPRVLVAEDEPVLLGLLQELFEDWGCEVYAFQSADAACSFMRDARPQLDLLFTDVRMPGVLSGIDLALQARRWQADLPIVITSGYYDEQPACAVQAVFLPKPWDLQTLLERCPVPVGQRRYA
ncbi:response regulator [uncultured Pseudomonas sp.]|uniref:response regulator n=1 Tax=uncultured Pseudomonas sp. TaxID=114707 RepID=UPI0025D5D694|nr:response regulator [uncultured Pseudomonas sp.]